MTSIYVTLWEKVGVKNCSWTFIRMFHSVAAKQMSTWSGCIIKTGSPQDGVRFETAFVHTIEIEHSLRLCFLIK